MALAVRQVLYLQPIFKEKGYDDITQSTIVFGDNKPAIASIGNDSSKSRTKHIDVRLKFCGEVVRGELLKIQYVPTAQNIADLFTKPLPAARFRTLRESFVTDVKMFLDNHPSDTAKLLSTMKNRK